MQQVSPRIAEGFRLISTRHFLWFTLVSASKLDLKHARKCILGQVFGSYEKGLDFLEVKTQEEAIRLGFYAANDNEWSELDDAWRGALDLAE